MDEILAGLIGGLLALGGSWLASRLTARADLEKVSYEKRVEVLAQLQAHLDTVREKLREVAKQYTADDRAKVFIERRTSSTKAVDEAFHYRKNNRLWLVSSNNTKELDKEIERLLQRCLGWLLVYEYKHLNELDEWWIQKYGKKDVDELIRGWAESYEEEYDNNLRGWVEANEKEENALANLLADLEKEIIDRMELK